MKVYNNKTKKIVKKTKRSKKSKIKKSKIKKRSKNSKKIRKKRSKKKGGTDECNDLEKKRKIIKLMMQTIKTNNIVEVNKNISILLKEFNVKDNIYIRYSLNDDYVLKIHFGYMDSTTNNDEHSCSIVLNCDYDCYVYCENDQKKYSKILYFTVLATFEYFTKLFRTVDENMTIRNIYIQNCEETGVCIPRGLLQKQLLNNYLKSTLLQFDMLKENKEENEIYETMYEIYTIEKENYTPDELQYLKKKDFDIIPEKKHICGSFNCIYKLKNEPKFEDIKELVILREFKCNDDNLLDYYNQLREKQTDIFLYNLKKKYKSLEFFKFVPSIYYIHYNKDECYYSIIEFIKGDTLDKSDIISNDETKQKVFDKLLLYLKYAEELEIVHADLKGSNIMYNKENDDVKIVDFGLSKKVDDKHPGYMTQSFPYMDLKILFEKKYKIMNDFYSILIMFLYKLQRRRDEQFDNYLDEIVDLNDIIININLKQGDYKLNEEEYKNYVNRLVLSDGAPLYKINLYNILKKYIDGYYDNVSFKKINNSNNITKNIFEKNQEDFDTMLNNAITGRILNMHLLN